MKELKSNTVIDALIAEIGKIFPTVTRYQEAMTSLEFPHFFVFQLTLDSQKDNYNRWWVNYFFNVRYRHAADPSTQPNNLNEELDRVGMGLVSSLDYINYDNTLFRVKNCRYEKIDGVLHFFCNVRVRTTKPLPAVPLQQVLETDIGTR